jgi:hypothetical protein
MKINKLIHRQTIILIIFITLMTSISLYSFVYYHEHAHLQNFNRFGYNASIHWGVLKSYTYTTGITRNVTELENIAMEMMHQHIEDVAVNTQISILNNAALMGIITIVALMLEITYLKVKEKEWEEKNV